MRKEVLGSLAVAVGLVAANQSPAAAATTVGELFPADNICGPMVPNPPTMTLQTTSPGNRYAVPSVGVITAWSHQAGPNAPELRLKVARPTGGNNYTIVGESPFVTPANGVVSTFGNIRIPVQPGDVIGFAVRVTGSCGRSGAAATGYGTSNNPDDVPLGTNAEFTPVPLFQLSVAANLEPDCDADGLGDETQDPSLLGGGCAARQRLLELEVSKHSVKRDKRVRLTGELNEAGNEPACEAGQTIELQRKKPKRSTFVLFKRVTTSATGGFRAKVKVKRTFRYRAQVAEGGGCAAAVSGAEKIRVKRASVD